MVNLDKLKTVADKIKLVITDIDGVWTDGKMYYSKEGEHLKAFSTFDGMGCARLFSAGIDIAVITGENSPSVKKRVEKLKISKYYPGISNKKEIVKEILKTYNIDKTQTAYIGDDINDLEAMKEVGLSAAPSESFILDFYTPDIITKRKGGQGAFREFAELILKYKGRK